MNIEELRGNLEALLEMGFVETDGKGGRRLTDKGRTYLDAHPEGP